MLYKPSENHGNCLLHFLLSDSITYTMNTSIHLSQGPEKPTDFDEHMSKISLYDRRSDIAPPITAKLSSTVESKLGPCFDAQCRGEQPALKTNNGVIAMLVWIYNLHKAWGMTEFANSRASSTVLRRKVFSTARSKPQR